MGYCRRSVLEFDFWHSKTVSRLTDYGRGKYIRISVKVTRKQGEDCSKVEVETIHHN